MKEIKIAIIGLGYVGFPIAVEFGKKFKTIGYDVKRQRVEELKKGIDKTREVDAKSMKLAKLLTCTCSIDDIKDCNYYIVTVPTPIDDYKQPDLTPLKKASETIGKILNKGDIVIYESTVYPGCTEEVCVPILEKFSNFKFNKDFYCGFSPERINPGDKVHRVTSIKKITSGSTLEIAEKIDNLYKSIIIAGTHKASSIKVAEAAKIIENTQRDINIAFVNELALLFDKMDIDTFEVLEAAGTKWNFLPFRPGLVGGHCIGVDPYYLTYKAESLGYHPEVILAGRRINDTMGIFVANKVIKLMINKDLKIQGSTVLVLGMTFKENCPDIRNSKVIDIIEELKEFGCNIDVYDPWADKDEVKEEYGINLLDDIKKDYNAIILAVAHEKFKELDLDKFKKENACIYDLKGFFNKNEVDKRL